MDSRKLIALFLVFALTGSALAAQQQRLYHKENGGPAEANGVTAVQQHSVFIEIVVEEENQTDQKHKFAAVVGLVKKCVKNENVFDNAVLWFNDQFLFGDKRASNTTNVTDKGLGYQPNENVTTDSGDGYIGQTEEGTPRWGGCYTPDGFVHAIGADDPFGTFNANVSGQEESVPAKTLAGQTRSNIDTMKQLISLDNTCQGCIFEYDSSLFVVDPNGHEWIVDKYVYPLSVLGNVFTGDTCGESGDQDQATPLVDPKVEDQRSSKHANECHDDPDGDNDEANHRGEGSGDDLSRLSEPLFSVHLQVNPQNPGLGFADKQPYKFTDSNGTEQVRDGAIYPTEGSEQRSTCENAPNSWRCAIEYNFLLAVDFGAFDDAGINETQGDAEVRETGENEITGGCAVSHGQGGADNGTEYWQGNSHPHNPDPNATQDPGHCHSTVDLDIFFMRAAGQRPAPYFTMEHRYWADNAGTPASWGPNCESGQDIPAAADGDPVADRTPLVCDYDDDDGEYHAHDGTQTVNSN